MNLLSKTAPSILMLGLMILCLHGCNQSAVPKPTVGLIDMDLVLNKTGRLKVIEAEVRKKNNEIQASLKLIEKGLLSDLQKMQKSIGDKPTPEQEKALQQEALKAQQSMQSESQKGKQEFDDFLLKQREKYITNEINPVIQSICQEKGYYMVLLKSQAIVHDKTIDITDEVIAKFGAMPDQPANTAVDPTMNSGGEVTKTELPKPKPMPSGDISITPPGVPASAKSLEPTKPSETAQPVVTPTTPESPKVDVKPDSVPAQPAETKTGETKPDSKADEPTTAAPQTPAPTEKN